MSLRFISAAAFGSLVVVPSIAVRKPGKADYQQSVSSRFPYPSSFFHPLYVSSLCEGDQTSQHHAIPAVQNRATIQRWDDNWDMRAGKSILASLN